LWSFCTGKDSQSRKKGSFLGRQHIGRQHFLVCRQLAVWRATAGKVPGRLAGGRKATVAKTFVREKQKRQIMRKTGAEQRVQTGDVRKMPMNDGGVNRGNA